MPSSSSNGHALLTATGLRKCYGGRAVVDGVSLGVSPGEIVGLLGPNGAGKTTSFYMIAGLVPPDAGSVQFNGIDISRMPMHRRARLGLGYLPQEESVFRKLTAFENLLAVLETRPNLSKKQRIARAEDLLERFKISRVRNSEAIALSGGEKRRLAILITDHSVRETLSIVDRAFLIHDGRVILEGASEVLVNDPMARKHYLGEDFRM